MAFENFKGKTFKQISSSATSTKKEAHKKIPLSARHGINSSKAKGLIDYGRIKTVVVSNPDAYHIEQDNDTKEIILGFSASEFRFLFNDLFQREFSGTAFTDISASFFSQFGVAADRAELNGQKFMMFLAPSNEVATGSYSFTHGIVDHNANPSLKNKKVTMFNTTPTESFSYATWGGLGPLIYEQDDAVSEWSFLFNVTKSLNRDATSSRAQSIVSTTLHNSGLNADKNIEPLHTASAVGGNFYSWDGLITSSYAFSQSILYGPNQAFDGLTGSDNGYRAVGVSSSNILLSYDFKNKRQVNGFIGTIGPNHSLVFRNDNYPIINQIKLYFGDENYYHKQVQISGSMDGGTWTGIAEESSPTDNSDARTFKFDNTRGYAYYGVYFKSGSYKNGHQLRITGIEYDFYPFHDDGSPSQIFHLTSSFSSSTRVGAVSGSPLTSEVTLKSVKQFTANNTHDISEGVYIENIMKGKIIGDGEFGEGEASASAFNTNGNALFTPSKNFLIYPSESIIRSGSFKFSTSSAAYAKASGATTTLYYLKGTTGPSGSYSGAFGVSSGSHIFSNSTLETPASSGYYHIPGTNEVLFAFKQGVTEDFIPTDFRETLEVVPRFTSKSIH